MKISWFTFLSRISGDLKIIHFTYIVIFKTLKVFLFDSISYDSISVDRKITDVLCLENNAHVFRILPFISGIAREHWPQSSNRYKGSCLPL